MEPVLHKHGSRLGQRDAAAMWSKQGSRDVARDKERRLTSADLKEMYAAAPPRAASLRVGQVWGNMSSHAASMSRSVTGMDAQVHAAHDAAAANGSHDAAAAASPRERAEREFMSNSLLSDSLFNRDARNPFEKCGSMDSEEGDSNGSGKEPRARELPQMGVRRAQSESLNDVGMDGNGAKAFNPRDLRFSRKAYRESPHSVLDAAAAAAVVAGASLQASAPPPNDDLRRRSFSDKQMMGWKIQAKRISDLSDWRRSARALSKHNSNLSEKNEDAYELMQEEVESRPGEIGPRLTLDPSTSLLDFAPSVGTSPTMSWFVVVPNAIRGELNQLRMALLAIDALGTGAKESQIKAFFAWFKTLEDMVSVHIEFLDSYLINKIKSRLNEKDAVYVVQDQHDLVMKEVGRIRRCEKLLKERAMDKTVKYLLRAGCVFVSILLETLKEQEVLLIRFETETKQTIWFLDDLRNMRFAQVDYVTDNTQALRAFEWCPTLPRAKKSFPSDNDFDQWKVQMLVVFSKKHYEKRQAALRSALKL